MDVGVLQFLILERRAGEVRVDFRTTGNQRGSRIRVREADRNVVEFLVVVVTEQLGGFDLQGARLKPTPAAGTAMRSLSVKSLRVLTLGLLVSR